MPFLPLENRDELRIGLYIKIEGSWFSHPFSTNTFKIKFKKDLATLRSLTKVKLLYDPERSDPITPEEREEEDSTQNVGQRAEELIDEPIDKPLDSEPDLRTETEERPTTVLTNDEMLEARRKAFEARRKQLRNTEQAYQGVLQQSKLMFRELRTGHAKGIGRASGMVASLGKIIRDPSSSMALMNLMGATEEVEDFFMHSLNVSALSMMLAQEFTQDEDEIQYVGTGALFHDLGLLESERMSSSPKAYVTTPDSRTLRKHPQNGRLLTERFLGISYHSLDIIEQHHERLDGSGYPAGLIENEISLFSKIVMVVDEYDELCNHPDITKSLTPYEALCYLYSKRRGPLWDDAVVSLVHMLSIYPPGTLVELSDGKLGIVSSVNPQSRMNPWVMIYSEDYPREEAPIIDLSQEEGLSIVKSFQPKQIPYIIREYLNPRRMISYFPSQGDSSSSQPTQAGTSTNRSSANPDLIVSS